MPETRDNCTQMAADPNPDNWQRWLGGGVAAGGFVGALLSKLHTRFKGPSGASDAQLNDLVSRIDQLEVDRDRMDRENKRILRRITEDLVEIRGRLP